MTPCGLVSGFVVQTRLKWTPSKVKINAMCLLRRKVLLTGCKEGVIYLFLFLYFFSFFLLLLLFIRPVYLPDLSSVTILFRIVRFRYKTRQE